MSARLEYAHPGDPAAATGRGRRMARRRVKRARQRGSSARTAQQLADLEARTGRDERTPR